MILWHSFLSPLSPRFLSDFGHNFKITVNSSGALAPGSEQYQVITGCCIYSALWCWLHPTSCAAAVFGLNDVGFNSLRSDLPPIPGYLIRGMILRVIKTSMAPCHNLVARDTLRPYGEISWVITFIFWGGKLINIPNVLNSGRNFGCRSREEVFFKHTFAVSVFKTTPFTKLERREKLLFPKLNEDFCTGSNIMVWANPKGNVSIQLMIMFFSPARPWLPRSACGWPVYYSWGPGRAKGWL